MSNEENTYNEQAIGSDTQVETVDEVHGHAFQQQERDRTLWRSFRKDPKLLLSIFLVLWVLVARGFESATGSLVLSIPVFQEEFGTPIDGTHYVSAKWQSALSGGSYGVKVLGLLVTTYSVDKFGFRRNLFISTGIDLVGLGILYATTSLGMYLAGGMIVSFSVGMMATTIGMYVAELSPLAIRSTLLGVNDAIGCIGSFLMVIMSNFTVTWTTSWAWKSLYAAALAFMGSAFIGLFFVSESPVYLVRHSKIDEARKVLRNLYTLESDADGHLEKVIFTLAEEKELSAGSYLDCFRGSNLRRTLLAIFVFLAESFGGLSFVGGYGPLLYEMIGVSPAESFHIQIGAQILSISGSLIGSMATEFVGRRPVFITGCISVGVLLLLMASTGTVPHDHKALTASIGFLTMYNFIFNAGLGSIAVILAAEVPTSNLRAKTFSIALIVEHCINCMWTFVNPYIMNPGFGDLTVKYGYVFTGCMAIWAVIAWWYIPETRLRTYEELDEMFANHVPARKFRKYKTTGAIKDENAFRLEQKAVGEGFVSGVCE